MNFAINVSKIFFTASHTRQSLTMSSHALLILNNMALVILNSMAANDSHGQLCLHPVPPMMPIQAKKMDDVTF